MNLCVYEVDASAVTEEDVAETCWVIVARLIGKSGLLINLSTFSFHTGRGINSLLSQCSTGRRKTERESAT